ncbi:MAG: hypothetical protein AB7G15_17705 [Alphaproteobacteria bacterium]
MTAHQEQFCALIAAGHSAAAAYRGSFACDSMGANAVYVEASRLKKQPKILARIAALRAALPEHERGEAELDDAAGAAGALGAPRPAGTVAETLRLVGRLKAEPDLLQWEDKRAGRLSLKTHLGQLARIRDLALARGHYRVALAAECERASYGKLRDDTSSILKTLQDMRARDAAAARARNWPNPPA